MRVRNAENYVPPTNRFIKNMTIARKTPKRRKSIAVEALPPSPPLTRRRISERRKTILELPSNHELLPTPTLEYKAPSLEANIEVMDVSDAANDDDDTNDANNDDDDNDSDDEDYIVTDKRKILPNDPYTFNDYDDVVDNVPLKTHVFKVQEVSTVDTNYVSFLKELQDNFPSYDDEFDRHSVSPNFNFKRPKRYSSNNNDLWYPQEKEPRYATDNFVYMTDKGKCLYYKAEEFNKYDPYCYLDGRLSFERIDRSVYYVLYCRAGPLSVRLENSFQRLKTTPLEDQFRTAFKYFNDQRAVKSIFPKKPCIRMFNCIMSEEENLNCDGQRITLSRTSCDILMEYFDAKLNKVIEEAVRARDFRGDNVLRGKDILFAHNSINRHAPPLPLDAYNDYDFTKIPSTSKKFKALDLKKNPVTKMTRDACRYRRKIVTTEERSSKE